jgi:hypothetical protein
MYTVTGVVKLADGTPAAVLEGEEITFTSTTRPMMARAEIGPDARFRAYTDAPGDGMEPGTYKVRVSWSAAPRSEGEVVRKKAPFDRKALDVPETQILVTFKPGTNDLDIVLPPPRTPR